MFALLPPWRNTFIFYVPTVHGRLDVNVALHRPSYLSSVRPDAWSPHGPNLGNDGDKVNCHGMVTGNSVAHTVVLDVNPWYVVDLGVALEVAGVNLTNRQDMNRKCEALSCC